jgi:hypothetical protein
MNLIEMTGQRFGRLVVLQKDDKPRMWLCLCDCGAKKLVSGSNLRNASIKSCGCLAAEWSRALGANPEFVAKRSQAVTKHGHKRRGAISDEYRTWLQMKRRCYDTRSKDYPNWGGRGIRVCEEWRQSFEKFLADMGSRPVNHTLDRIDPNADYSPTNCRWATVQQQGSENKRTLQPVTVLGIKYPSMKAAARAHGVGLTTVLQRISSGIDIDTAFSEVSRLKPRRSYESYLPKSKR